MTSEPYEAPAIGTDMARAFPDTAVRVVYVAWRGGGDVLNAYDVLESAFPDAAERMVRDHCADGPDLLRRISQLRSLAPSPAPRPWTRHELEQLRAPELREIANGMPYRWERVRQEIIAWILRYQPVRPVKLQFPEHEDGRTTCLCACHRQDVQLDSCGACGAAR